MMMVDLGEYKIALSLINSQYPSLNKSDVSEIVDRAIAAESKLAEIEAQEPIARGYKNSQTGTCSELYWLGDIPEGETNLYAKPVQPSPAVSVPDEVLKSFATMTSLVRLKYGNLDKDVYDEIENAEALIAGIKSTPTPPSAERPENCRNRQRDEGKAYPKSGCEHCKTGGLTGCPFEQQKIASPKPLDCCLYWRNDAIENAAVIADHYEQGFVAQDIRSMKSKVEQPDSAAVEPIANTVGNPVAYCHSQDLERLLSGQCSVEVFSMPAWVAKSRRLNVPLYAHAPTKPQRITEQELREPTHWLNSKAKNSVISNASKNTKGTEELYKDWDKPLWGFDITEDFAHRICVSFAEFYDEDSASSMASKWLEAEGRTLLAKLNEHREPDYKAQLTKAIASVERRFFRTNKDTGAVMQAQIVLNAFRNEAGLPDIFETDLPKWDADQRFYVMPPDSNLLANAIAKASASTDSGVK